MVEIGKRQWTDEGFKAFEEVYGKLSPESRSEEKVRELIEMRRDK